MIDALPRTHMPLFAETPRKLPRSFYWGAGFALLLHAGLIYYLVAHNFTQAIVDPALPPEQTMVLSMDAPQPPKPAPPPPPNTISVHRTVLPPVLPDTTPLTPQPITDPGPDTKQPPVIAQQPANPGGDVKDTGSSSSSAPVAPRWKAFPNGDTLSEYYPPRAIDGEVEGTASVQCTVLDTAGHVRCVVAAESPKGYGFGDATVRMVEAKGRVDTSAGDIRPGSLLSITTVKWQLN